MARCIRKTLRWSASNKRINRSPSSDASRSTPLKAAKWSFSRCTGGRWKAQVADSGPMLSNEADREVSRRLEVDVDSPVFFWFSYLLSHFYLAKLKHNTTGHIEKICKTYAESSVL